MINILLLRTAKDIEILFKCSAVTKETDSDLQFGQEEPTLILKKREKNEKNVVTKPKKLKIPQKS